MNNNIKLIGIFIITLLVVILILQLSGSNDKKEIIQKQEISENFGNSNAKITLYHAEYCGHCLNFLPLWKDLQEDFKSMGVLPVDYECSKNPGKCSKIEGLPTIILTKDNKEHIYPLNKPREKNSILNFVRNII